MRAANLRGHCEDLGVRASCAVVLLATSLLGAGCESPDHRMSLNQFMELEEASRQSTSQVIAAMPPSVVDQQFGPYKVGHGDVLRVTLTSAQTPPLLPAMVRIDRDGTVMLPVIGAVQVADRELEDVEDAIRDAYVPAVFGEAVVHVELLAPEATNVVVTGAVTLPGFVKLRRTERDLLHAIVAAGGLSQAAAGKATLRRVRNPGETITLDLTDPVQVNQAMALAPLENGDIVSVQSASLNTVYIGGLVNRPAPLVLPAGVQLTALQALAGASGVRTDVTPSEATLIRRMPDGTDAHVRLNIDRMACGQDPNIMLAAGDILWVPETLETKVQDFINRNIFMRAGVSVTYNVSGIEFLNRRELQGEGVGGNNNLESTFDPLGFLNRDAALQDLTSRPVVP
jgi:protein involved in polysaccharide export with SLBB domain